MKYKAIEKSSTFGTFHCDISCHKNLVCKCNDKYG